MKRQGAVFSVCDEPTLQCASLRMLMCGQRRSVRAVMSNQTDCVSFYYHTSASADLSVHWTAWCNMGQMTFYFFINWDLDKLLDLVRFCPRLKIPVVLHEIMHGKYLVTSHFRNCKTYSSHSNIYSKTVRIDSSAACMTSEGGKQMNDTAENKLQLGLDLILWGIRFIRGPQIWETWQICTHVY